jgi:hypothetical protein
VCGETRTHGFEAEVRGATLASTVTNTQPVTTPSGDVEQHLTYLKLAFIAQHYAPLAQQAAQHAWSHVDYLAKLRNYSGLEIVAQQGR